MKSVTPQRLARLVLPPLIILVIAAAMMIWGPSQRNSASADVAVDEFVRQLVLEAQLGDRGPVTKQIMREPIGPDIMQRLRDLLDGHRPVNGDVKVTRGDVKAPLGDGTATHTAVVRLDADATIGLRLRYDHDSSTVRLLGLWIPTP